MNGSQIAVFGYYGHKNAGDDAFQCFFDQALGPGVRYLKSPNDIRERSSRLILGGGAVVNDYFMGRLPESDRLDIIGCSFPYGDGDVQHLTAVRERLGMVALRSRRDAEVARSHGIDAVEIPDLVFGIDNPKASTSFDIRHMGALPLLRAKADRTMVFLLSDHYTNRSPKKPDDLWPMEIFKRELAAALDVLTASWNIIMIPMSVWYNANDYAFAFDVLARTKDPYKVTAIDSYLGPARILEMVSATADVVVSMKYHGLVFGAICGKRIINIGNTRKNIDLINEIGIPDHSFPTEFFTSTGLIDLLEREPNLAPIDAYTRQSRERLVPVVRELRSLYWGHGAEGEMI